MKIPIISMIALMIFPLLAMGQTEKLNKYRTRKFNVKVIGGMNTHFLLYRYKHDDILKRINSLQPQIGIELEYQNKKRFALAIEANLVQAKERIKTGYNNTGSIYPLHPFTKITVPLFYEESIRNLNYTYLSLPFFIKYDLGKKRTLSIKVGLQYNIFLRDKNNQTSTQEVYGIFTYRNNDIENPSFRAYTNPIKSSGSHSPCPTNSIYNNCTQPAPGCSIGIEKRNFLRNKLDLELRYDYIVISSSANYYRASNFVFHNYAVTEGLSVFALKIKYNLITKKVRPKYKLYFGK